MKKLTRTFLFAGAIILASCSSSSNDKSTSANDETLGTDETQITPKIGASQRSECLGHDKADVSSGPGSNLEVTVAGDTVTITDHAATFNCCLASGMEASVADGVITVVEKELDDPANGCDCECSYEMSISVSRLPAGQQIVRLYRGFVDESSLLGTACPFIGTDGPVPVIGLSKQSACLESAKTASGDVSVVVESDAITVTDAGAVFNCCLESWMEADLETGVITIVERESLDLSSACDCQCTFELSLRISNLAAGSYEVKVYKRDIAEGSLLADQTVTITACEGDCG